MQHFSHEQTESQHYCNNSSTPARVTMPPPLDADPTSSSSLPTSSESRSQNATLPLPEPFPVLKGDESQQSNADYHVETRGRDTSSASTIQQRLRSASKKFEESNPPTGFMIATGTVATYVPGVTDIQTGAFNSDGWTAEGQVRERARISSASRRSSQSSQGHSRPVTASDPASPQGTPYKGKRHESVPEVVEEDKDLNLGVIQSGVEMGLAKKSFEKVDGSVEMQPIEHYSKTSTGRSSGTQVTPQTSEEEDVQYKREPFDNGYEFPPKQKWTTATVVGLKAFWKFFITPFGFLLTIYGLNIVAWGGMLFLLLCNASPAMCRPTCNDIQSPRRIWIEIDSQILNALFCVTGFGLIPWRFRDLYYLLQYRLQHKEIALRRLAGINRGWFRLEGSQNLPVELGPEDIETGYSNVPESTIPYPINKIADAPLTGNRAPPTKMWKLDFVIWTMVWNTFLQIVLSFFMWYYNRYERPSWSTGFFVALACIVAAAGGIMSFVEGKHVKAIEGVPVTDEEKETLRKDREAGILHWNNIKDEKPKEKKEKRAGLFRRKSHQVDT